MPFNKKKKVLLKKILPEELLHSDSFKPFSPIYKSRKRQRVLKKKSTEVTHGLINSKRPVN